MSERLTIYELEELIDQKADVQLSPSGDIMRKKLLDSLEHERDAVHALHRPDAPCRSTELGDPLPTDRFEAVQREDYRRQVALVVLANLIDKPWDREQKALEAVLQAEALLSALDPKR